LKKESRSLRTLSVDTGESRRVVTNSKNAETEVCGLSGSYHSAIRELRYALDSISQAYYLDFEHPYADIACKLEIIKKIDKELFGSRFIDRLELQGKREMKQLYSELSKYMHSTYKEPRPTIEKGKIFDRVTFGLHSLREFSLGILIRSLAS
jgi:hypothetical protein